MDLAKPLANVKVESTSISEPIVRIFYHRLGTRLVTVQMIMENTVGDLADGSQQ